MSVHQTREHFLGKYGYIVDNPQVGPELQRAYWECGNTEMFLDLVQNLTGKPLSGDAWGKSINEDVEERLAAERKAYDAGVAKGTAFDNSPIEGLNMTMRVVDGDDILADSTADGGVFGACQKFAAAVRSRM